MFILILIILWIAAIIYLGVHDTKPDDPTDTGDYSGGKFDRIIRAYVFIFGIILVITLLYKLIWFFSSIHVVSVPE